MTGILIKILFSVKYFLVFWIVKHIQLNLNSENPVSQMNQMSQNSHNQVNQINQVYQNSENPVSQMNEINQNSETKLTKTVITK